MVPIALKQRFAICPELAIGRSVHSLADLGRISQGKRVCVTQAGLGACAHLACLWPRATEGISVWLVSQECSHQYQALSPDTVGPLEHLDIRIYAARSMP